MEVYINYFCQWRRMLFWKYYTIFQKPIWADKVNIWNSNGPAFWSNSALPEIKRKKYEKLTVNITAHLSILSGGCVKWRHTVHTCWSCKIGKHEHSRVDGDRIVRCKSHCILSILKEFWAASAPCPLASIVQAGTNSPDPNQMWTILMPTSDSPSCFFTSSVITHYHVSWSSVTRFLSTKRACV